MDNFVISARKYRPSRFEDVIGQPQVTDTLKNAVRNNHVAQAFLFCGPRGVGKTTCARILAKVINCENVTKDIEPCNECESCRSFNQNASFNIHELDAASNNSVEDMRNLIDQVRFVPQEGKKKIYIIDEVHMLSQSAFNAFLKTLEEPPPYAIFILATTEKHKIIPTILSRCQIFDFNRIKVQDTVNYLLNIAKKENIATEPDALHIIAQKSDGALRDALSIFDRMSIFSNGKILYADVIKNLNILDYDYFFRFVDFFLAENISESLLTFNEILEKGFEGDDFLQGLSEHCRNILVCKDPETVVLIEAPDNLRQRYLNQVSYTPASFLLNALIIINEADIQYRTSKNKRLTVELALTKLSFIQSAVKLAKEGTLTVEAKKKPQPQPTESLTASPIIQVSKPVHISTEVRTKNEVIPPSVKIFTKEEHVKKTISDSEKEKNETPVAKITKSPIDPVLLKAAWNEYLEFLKGQNKDPILPLLKAILPEVIEDGVIQFTVASLINVGVLEGERKPMSDFLKTELNIDSIEIRFSVDNRSNDDRAYTPSDKLKYMATKNPNLVDLVNKLDLELDF
jgi:DNA polymerase III subunit gamma/tau